MDSLNQIAAVVWATLVVLLAPLFAFILSAALGKRMRSGWLATVAMVISLIAAIFVFSQIWNNEPIHQQIQWFQIGNHPFAVGLILNNLSVVLLVLVCAIALPVFIYSRVYMKGDPGIHRYWMYLSLFCFAMLGLVVADGLLLLYMCWELVGFASYLLIGFWFTKEAAIKANKKAFLINRIGDLGFLIGIAILYTQFQTLDIITLFGEQGLVKQAPPTVLLTWAGIAFFLGAMAKSAQFPFHVWLPDAMEGPTSVSSLIHAATMVAAGVFMLVRISPLFDAQVLFFIAGIGAFTAFMAATIAVTQQDLKKILAFSTISQLGFMMVAIGLGQYGVAIFHLVTHAFFKCLLFLSAGAVIHEMSHLKVQHRLNMDPQDIRNMGGLRKFMPWTFRLTAVAALALAGLPLTAGYLSKDAILIYAFEWSEWQSGVWKIIPISLLISSALTAFYIARLVFKVFFGKFRLNRTFRKQFHLHEAPKGMRYPMVFLAIGSLYFLYSYNPLVFEDAWLLRGLATTTSLQRVNIYHTVIPAAVNGLSIIFIYVAWRWYGRRKYPIRSLSGPWYRFSEAQWYGHHVYGTIVKGTLGLAKILYAFDRKVVDGFVNSMGGLISALGNIARWLDCYIVDALINGLGNLSFKIGGILRGPRKGKVQYYMLSMFLVLLVVLLIGLQFF
ncbi:NADH-quinone oxidoreductase subunit L [Olivibacter ginsenosidimutans]|uniref:NADH-quinone oxidoreductase subunit L n=1 Tax=Olivibacter ginsenosidimutans TaxID=1176537 RepID=A0ABP9AHC4_9SPHI